MWKKSLKITKKLGDEGDESFLGLIFTPNAGLGCAADVRGESVRQPADGPGRPGHSNLSAEPQCRSVSTMVSN